MSARRHPTTVYYLNLWWGIVLLVFGIVMLLMGKRATRTIPKASDED